MSSPYTTLIAECLLRLTSARSGEPCGYDMPGLLFAQTDFNFVSPVGAID